MEAPTLFPSLPEETRGWERRRGGKGRLWKRGGVDLEGMRLRGGEVDQGWRSRRGIEPTGEGRTVQLVVSSRGGEGKTGGRLRRTIVFSPPQPYLL